MFSTFYRHENITLRSVITFDCPNVTSRRLAWTIHNQADGRAIVPSVPTDQSEFSLPARLLPHGKYRFTFSVQLSDAAAVLLASKAFLIIEILSSVIQVNLLASPLSTISHGVSQDLILNPGQYSIDPAETSFPAEVSLSPYNQSRSLCLAMELHLLLSARSFGIQLHRIRSQHFRSRM